MSPRITVLMPVYNCESYIIEAVDSILNQDFSDFELLIIDDASTDKTADIIKTYTDNRIRLIEKPLNTGLTNSLNIGLKLAKGEYIARMDGDDISLPRRFTNQVVFLDQNPEVILCGTLYQIIGTDFICDHPATHEEIKVKLISGCYIAHPTVMIRKSVLIQNNLEYNADKEPAEDYDLWSHLIFLGKVANLNEVLLYYRVHSMQTSMLRNEKQAKLAREIKIRMLQKITPSIDDEHYFVNLSISRQKNEWKDKLQNKIKLFDLLVKGNDEKNIYDLKLFEKFIHDEKKDFYKTISKKKEFHSIKKLPFILFNFPSLFINIGFKESGKFLLKSFLNYSSHK